MNEDEEDARIEKMRRLREEFEADLGNRVDRHADVAPHWITGAHHFAAASAECLRVYRDGHFIAALVLAQSVAEGLARFVVDRQRVQPLQGESKRETIKRMSSMAIVSTEFHGAFESIMASHRNDLHHMNPSVAGINVAEMARRVVKALGVMEKDIFECRPGPAGTLHPVHPEYWDPGDSPGTFRAFLRL